MAPGVHATQVPPPSQMPPGHVVSMGAGGNVQLPPEHWSRVQLSPSVHALQPDVWVSVPTTVNVQLVPLQL